MDMSSGGGIKEPPYEHIYIEAPIKEATLIFCNRFGHTPEHVTCSCCGEDYSVNENESLYHLTGHSRGCRYIGSEDTYVEEPSGWRNYQTLDEYMKNPDVLFIHKSSILPSDYISFTNIELHPLLN
jgi:hypothetical protein